MKRFEYRARDADGRVMTGEVVAPDSQVAAQLVQDAGVFLVSISEAKLRRRGWAFLEPVSIPLEERLFLLQSWSMLLKSGFSMQSALLQLQKSTHLHSVDRVLGRVQRSIDEGMTLSQALAASHLFPPSWIASLRAAEDAGDLVPTLCSLRERALELQRLKTGLLGWLWMPAFILGLALIWLWLFLRHIAPTLNLFAAAAGMPQHPWSGALLAASDVILNGVRWGAFGLFLLVWLHWRTRRSDQEVGLLQAYTPTWLPVLGTLAARLNLVAIAAGLKTQMDAGISVMQAVETLSEGIPHPGIRRDLFEVYRKLRSGSPFPEAISCLRILPTAGLSLIEAGSVSGKLTEFLEILIRDTEQAIREQGGRLAILLQTAGVLLVGLLVGLLVLSFWILIWSHMDVLLKGIDTSRPDLMERGMKSLGAP